MTFNTRKIGNTRLRVSELGLGTAAMAGNHRNVPESDHQAALEEGLSRGITYVDTAPYYGFGRSEHFAGDALRSRKDWVLSTKAGRLLRPGAPTDHEVDNWPGCFPFHQEYDYSYAGVMQSFEASLQRLGLDRIDILLLHDIGEMQHGKELNTKLQQDAMTGGYKALDELRRAGDIQAIGLGVNEREVCMDALQHGDWDAFLLAGRYTLLEQEPLDDLLPACEKAGTSIILGGPFNSGILAGGNTWNYASAPPDVVEKARRIAGICEDHKIPLPAAALQFPLAHQQVSTVIPGPRSAAEMAAILDWWSLDIPVALWSDLKTAGLVRDDAPVPA
ncbi:MAG: aldo/keto reductase [Gammaproteobacteria bacterium]|nr:aldo/keto reductase [Gammaproteobacteria bacterium]